MLLSFERTIQSRERFASLPFVDSLDWGASGSRAVAALQLRRIVMTLDARAQSANVAAVAASSAVAVVVLGVAALLLRLPFQISVLDHWDSVQYALALSQFNVAVHRPQPPGSPYYVLLGRAVLAVVGDEHLAFTVLSVLAGAAAVGCEYLLAARLFGRAAGWLAALALLTEPPFWVYSASGNFWTFLALLSALCGLACLALLRSARGATYVSAVALGVASGFRLDVAVFLGPLWMWCLWKGEQSPRRRAIGVLIVGALVAAWLVPVVMLTPGGLGLWLSRYMALFVAPAASPGDRIREWLTNTLIIWGYALVMFGPMLALAGVLSWRRRATRSLGPPSRGLVPFFVLWVLPSFVFLWAFDTTEAGHALLFTTALLAAVAGFLSRAGRARELALAGVLVVALQTSLFYLAAPRTEQPFAYTANQVILRYNVSAMRQQERAVLDMVRSVRTAFASERVAILTLNGQTPYRFAMYYLPEYLVFYLDRPGQRPEQAARGRREFFPSCLPASIRTAVWVTEAPWPAEFPPAGVLAADVGGPSTALWHMSAASSDARTPLVPGLGTCPE